MASRALAALVLVISSLASVSAHAEDESSVNRARELGAEGVRAFERGEWEVARSLFHRARDLYSAPTLGVREARALVKLGRLVEAASVYERVASSRLDASDRNGDFATFRDAQHVAVLELGALRGRIPHLTLRVEGKFGRVAIEIDGRLIPGTLIGVDCPVDPGLHAIEATFDNRVQPASTITLAEGERRTLVLRAIAPPDSSPPGAAVQRMIGFVAIGVGVLGIGAGVGLGVAATNKHDALASICAGSVCPGSAAGMLDDFHTFRTASTVAYVLGGVLAAGGIALVIFVPRAKKARAAFVAPWIGVNVAGVHGVF